MRLTTPVASAGVTAVIDWSELITYDVAATEPNITPVTAEKPMPDSVTVFPPAVEPLLVSRSVMTGNANRFEIAFDPVPEPEPEVPDV